MFTRKYYKSPSKKLWVLYLVIFSIILIPSVNIPGIPDLRLEQVIAIGYFTRKTLKIVRKDEFNISKHKFEVFYLGFVFVIVASILMGSIKGIRVLANDFFEMFKIINYLGLYLLASDVIKSEEDKKRLVDFMILCILGSVIVAFQQYFNLFNLNEVYVAKIAPTQYITLVNNYPFPRVIGLTRNSNIYAVMTSIGAITAWATFLVNRDKKRLLMLFVFIIATLMTLSRSGFIFLLSGLAMISIFYVFRINETYLNNFKLLTRQEKTKKVILYSGVFILMLFIVYKLLPQELTWRLVSGLNIKDDVSFQYRLLNWGEHFDYFRASPIFGVGPIKSIQFASFVDNEWLLFLRRYGIVGTLYIITTFVIPFIISEDKFFKYVYLSILIAAALYMIPSILYNSFRPMSLIIVFASSASNKYDEVI